MILYFRLKDENSHKQTHSIDSFITDSANSASALYSGHKSAVNSMGVYADSSPDAFDGPKVQPIVELHNSNLGSAIGVVSTAFLADATPIALTGVCLSPCLAMSLLTDLP
jgi:alkaline phosphatase